MSSALILSIIVLIIVLFFLTLILIGFGGGQDRLITGLWGFSLGILLGAPLVLLGILGGGDFKLMAVIGLATDWNSLLWMSVYSILWGGLLGLVRAILDKSALQLIKNSFAILNPLVKKEEITLHKIPYSIALFFGWITYTFLVGRV